MIDAGIQAVFFDAVGTVLFPRDPVARTYAEVARRHGLEVTEEKVHGTFRAAFARQEEIDSRTGWRTNEDRERQRWRAIVSEVLPEAAGCFDELWEWFSTPMAWTVNPEAADVLRDLAGRGLAVGIASNFDARLFGLVAALPELSPIGDRCAISSLIGWRKPARDFFDRVVSLAGCPARQILLVGDDRRNDVEGATAAGLSAVRFDPEDPGPGRIARLRDLLPG